MQDLPDRLRYHQLLRAAPRGRWWALLGIAALGLVFVVAQTLIAMALGAYLVLGGLDPGTALDRLSGQGEITPVFLVLVNLGWAVTIPLALGIVWAVHGLRPGWLSSVVPRLRWGWLMTCFGLSLLALLATLVVSTLVPAQDSVALTGGPNDFTSTTRDFLLVVVLLTPLQAAGEEYAFRGYLTQAFGGFFANPRVSLVAAVGVPALIFALAHGAQDPPIFVDRLAFGLVAGVLVVLTGGLEAGIAMHVLNNFLAFGIALAFSDMTSALNPTGGSWWSLPVTLTQSLVYLGVVVWVARRRGIATTTGVDQVAVLSARRTRV
ncbi:CAAX amino terminal protease self- immunity [Nocardioides dokdonensis FR1436]|uniref:CAAX amino terminal protease self-immunity n=1 Tax=Nocardioides dokdonensis FR1436 TaxID=1300347 RepID=A0A1A9GMK3_9ACTN|nr:type II CAAX endopeptidase family protein [Nocardioides dokdonensis]ANH38902.1 CAAX amino terminal protease self- immunity [Nocardioides dokdonensis FR1436]